MMLGKRARPPMKRTTSMTEFTLDLNGGAVPHDLFNGGADQQYLGAAAAGSPRPHRRNSSDFVQTANFLRVCCSCKRRLIPGRDIYMYRGDTAFCSNECRQQQVTQDERKEKKCSLMASKKEVAGASAGAQVSGAGETVPAVSIN